VPATAEKLAAAGFTVVGVDRNEAALRELPDGIRHAAGDPAVSRSLDDKIVAEAGSPEALVNTMGTYHLGEALAGTSEDLRFMIDVNVGTALWLTQAVAPYLRERGSGAVVHVAARPGLEPTVGMATYGQAGFPIDSRPQPPLSRHRSGCMSSRTARGGGTGLQPGNALVAQGQPMPCRSGSRTEGSPTDAKRINDQGRFPKFGRTPYDLNSFCGPEVTAHEPLRYGPDLWFLDPGPPVQRSVRRSNWKLARVTSWARTPRLRTRSPAVCPAGRTRW
jgi:hypothetical protein